VKCGSAGMCRRIRCKIYGNAVPLVIDFRELINKVRSIGSLLDKMSAKKSAVYSPTKKYTI